MMKYQLIDVKALLEGVKEFELPCMDTRKSFYGKALVIECKQKGVFLQSYNTIVCGIDQNNQFIISSNETSKAKIINTKLFFNTENTKIKWSN